MRKVYTVVSGIKQLYLVWPPVHKIIHSLKLVDYLQVQADNPWYNCYVTAEMRHSLATLNFKQPRFKCGYSVT